VAVVAVKQIREEIDELAVEAVAVEWVALLVMVDKVVILEEDLVQVQEIQVVLVLKPLEEVAVAVVTTLVKQVVHLVVQVVKHLVMLEMVEITQASRAFESNIEAMNTAKQLASRTLEILRK